MKLRLIFGHYYDPECSRTINIILRLYCLTYTYELLFMEIQRALEYINIRPLEYSIFRMFPLNAFLPLKFVSLCITYIIVSAQFTSLM
ncbi:uncharacterized protein LOC125071565 [Vanessa atalanta]|uniref:uncharacterized protein LOC125071565 n=1 Tax=Vanessa atalanta TaxID=42275 RepID=UPI001FCD3819|nr:uncharacterized protein LOC125071565 [Vanessa atalanta]